VAGEGRKKGECGGEEGPETTPPPRVTVNSTPHSPNGVFSSPEKKRNQNRQGMAVGRQQRLSS
jgi:hypothetical protein